MRLALIGLLLLSPKAYSDADMMACNKYMATAGRPFYSQTGLRSFAKAFYFTDHGDIALTENIGQLGLNGFSKNSSDGSITMIGDSDLLLPAQSRTPGHDFYLEKVVLKRSATDPNSWVMSTQLGQVKNGNFIASQDQDVEPPSENEFTINNGVCYPKSLKSNGSPVFNTNLCHELSDALNKAPSSPICTCDTKGVDGKVSAILKKYNVPLQGGNQIQRLSQQDQSLLAKISTPISTATDSLNACWRYSGVGDALHDRRIWANPTNSSKGGVVGGTDKSP